ncbi:MAG: hypothetical protein WC412_02445 [Candidatus Omnitrophota bacterium]|jgi:microcystin-dependent protein
MFKQNKFILKIFRILLLSLFFLLFSSSFVLHSSSLVYAEIPHLINYQGRLTDSGGVPLNGSYAVTFRIYDAETAGSLLWEETQSGVVVNKGIFSVLLGAVANLNIAFDKPYFLEIKVGNEVMTPRQRIASAAYAMRAENGVPKGVVVMWSGTIANIPSGWVLCDGANGTPDLRDRFVVGAKQDDGGITKTNVTGSLTKSGDGQIPSHAHGVGTLVTNNAGEHTHSFNVVNNYSGDSGGPMKNSPATSVGTFNTSSTGSHNHTISGSVSFYGTGTKNVATYYALAFIMKSE